MFGLIEITQWQWVGFLTLILFFLALDLGVFHRAAHVVRFKEALIWSAIWFLVAMAFAVGLVPTRGRAEALEFVTGYILELSLSMDNVFVIALLFSYFRVPAEYQHRVLFWGIFGALVMRGLMIWIGVELVTHFHWTLYAFGAFLVITGIKMLFTGEDGVHPETNPVVKLARKFFPITPDFEGQKFFSRLNGRFALTPLALVLLMVETTDLIFATDSIPAIFAVTQKPFIVFTSNVFAILGLRSLYFALAGAIGYFQHLKIGLSIVLIYIGVKMLIAPWLEIPTGLSLVVVAGIILLSILSSIIAARCGRTTPPT